MTCDKCKHFKILYEPLRTKGELWDMGRAKCDRRNLITDFANHGKFKRLDTCENFEPHESENNRMDRNCENCKHHTENGCTSWECEYEPEDENTAK